MASLGFSLVNCMDTISFLVTDIVAYAKMYFNMPKVKNSIKIFLRHIFKTYLHIQEVFMEENPGMAHKIVLNNRNQGNLPGILDVISFDENTIVLDTDMGLLTIKGKDLHVNRLSLEKGEIDIEGRTDSLVYSAGGGAKSGESFFAKLFK